MLVSIGGRKVIRGGNGIVDGPVGDDNVEMVMETIRIEGYGHLEDANARFTTSARNLVLSVLLLFDFTKRIS